MTPIRLISLCAATFLLAACVAAGPTPAVRSETAADRPLSDQQVQDIETRLQRLQDSIVMLEARLLDQQRIIDRLKQQTATGPSAGGQETAPGAAAVEPGGPAQTPTEIYLAAFGDYASGNYRKSIDGFSRFLQLFPANDYASNARYWLAECHLALEHYPEAAAEFDRVYVDYPKSSKAPDALLKKAAALFQMNEEQNALDTIQVLKERYPNSSAARKAAEGIN